jgi:hypothetical protein
MNTFKAVLSSPTGATTTKVNFLTMGQLSINAGANGLIKEVKESLKVIPKYYGKVHCSQDRPMVELGEVEKMLAELESKINPYEAL